MGRDFNGGSGLVVVDMRIVYGVLCADSVFYIGNS